MPSPVRPSWITAFHWKKRAAGASTALPGLVYGPDQRDHSLPGSSVLPDRTKNSSRGSLDLLLALASFPDGGGPHQSRRPHCEKSCASKERDSNVPSGSYSGPSENTFPGLAVQRNTLPSLPRARPVICADPDFASCAKTPWPSIVSSAPLLPVPASKRPSEAKPNEYTTSSREFHSSSGAPSGARR